MESNGISGSTIGEVTRQVADALAKAGLSDPPGEARWLVRAALGLSSAQLLSRSGEVLDQTSSEKVARFLARRARHEPLSRIMGEREFYGRIFEVTSATLDPRADSETLIDVALDMLGPAARTAELRVLDIGTGTGCLLLTLLAECPRATGVATDISPDAIAVAERNAARLDLQGRVAFCACDIAAETAGPFDVVVSNPPYIRSSELQRLEAGVREYDPQLALDGGADGLFAYRRIIQDLPRLVPDGLVLLEVGYDQADEIVEMMIATVGTLLVKPPSVFPDVAGIPRVVAARTRSPLFSEKGLGF